jgi:hypothetical protein
MHILVLGGQKHTQKNSLITWERMNTILLMHEQMLNDPWPNITYPHSQILDVHKDEQKRAQKCSSLVSTHKIKK